MRTRQHLGLLVVAAASVLFASSWVHVPYGQPVDIGSAHTTGRGADRAARVTESVRYADTTVALLASYAVADGRPAMPADSADHARDSRLWSLVRDTLPDEVVPTIRQLNVITDGRNGTLGMVHRSSVAADSWVLSMDPAEADDVLQDTLVHEYAHMLTLRTEDLASNAASRNGCAGVRLAIGCAQHDSALAEWHAEFWADTAEPAPSDWRRYVSEYAASSVHEDLAESFMAWTLEQVLRPSAQVSQRFAFFESRPEFVDARDAILAKPGR